MVGASAGGIEALRVLIGALPADLSASLFIVVHTSPEAPGMLADIFNHSGRLPATYVTDGERIEKGRIYVAPPDRHLLIESNRLRVTRGPKENRFRPAVNPLFRSAAQTYGPRVVGVILTGYMDDATAGLWTVKQLGGTAIVQDPSDALVPSMLNAVTHVNVDYCVPLEQIAPCWSNRRRKRWKRNEFTRCRKKSRLKLTSRKSRRRSTRACYNSASRRIMRAPNAMACSCK